MYCSTFVIILYLSKLLGGKEEEERYMKNSEQNTLSKKTELHSDYVVTTDDHKHYLSII